MYTDNPGTWLLHCHVMDHLVDGMEAKYAILHKGGELAADLSLYTIEDDTVLLR